MVGTGEEGFTVMLRPGEGLCFAAGAVFKTADMGKGARENSKLAFTYLTYASLAAFYSFRFVSRHALSMMDALAPR